MIKCFKKATESTAIEFTKENVEKVREVCKESGRSLENYPDAERSAMFFIQTIDEKRPLEFGDYIVIEPGGAVYPMKSDMFKKSFDEVK